MGFVDDYTRWTVGKTVEENMEYLQSEVVPRTLKWASSCGASFESKKTTLMHFVPPKSRGRVLQPVQPLQVGPALVGPSDVAKILGVLIDSQLTFKQHIAKVAEKGWKSACAISRLKGVRPATARQLYNSMVTSQIDYAAAVWFPRYMDKGVPAWVQKLLQPIERFAAKVIIGCFKTVSAEAACAEAHISPVFARLKQKITRFWTQAHTLPPTSLIWHSIKTTNVRATRAHKTPFSQIRRALKEPMENIETISAFTTAPWHQLPGTMVVVNTNAEEATEACLATHGREIQMFTSVSMKKNKTGYSIIVWCNDQVVSRIQRPTGMANSVNIYIAQLGAIKQAVEWASRMLNHTPSFGGATIYASNISALHSIANPKQQSGQSLIRHTIETLQKAKEAGKRIQLKWVPANPEIPAVKAASKIAAETTGTRSPQTETPWTSTRFKSAMYSKLQRELQIPGSGREWRTGRHLKQIDAALPGNHVKLLYDNLTRKESQILAQLRTGHCALNSFLAKIGAAENGLCECGQASESVRHFLLHCQKYQQLRNEMIEKAGKHYGDLSHMLGGKGRPQAPGTSETGKGQKSWKPDVTVVKTVIRFALNTGRLSNNT
jgi:hypothetical protein